VVLVFNEREGVVSVVVDENRLVEGVSLILEDVTMLVKEKPVLVLDENIDVWLEVVDGGRGLDVDWPD